MIHDPSESKFVKEDLKRYVWMDSVIAFSIMAGGSIIMFVVIYWYTMHFANRLTEDID